MVKPDDPSRAKSNIRRTVKARLSRVSAADRERFSRLLGLRFQGLSGYLCSKKVMFYVGIGLEIRTLNLIGQALASGKEVAVPVCDVVEKGQLLASRLHDTSQLVTGAYGLLEPKRSQLYPIDPAELDLIVLPGLAFDRNGNRVGKGGGYYDRLLHRVGPGTLLVALTLDCQILPWLPLEPHDRPLHLLVTPDKSIPCRPFLGRRE